jgi:DNA mismatch repair protein MutS
MSPPTFFGTRPEQPAQNDRALAVAFRSILFGETGAPAEIDRQGAPDFFTDLNLDQIVDPMTAGRDEYNLKPFFYTPLTDVVTINYRYEVLRDLEDSVVLGQIRSFAQEMRTMRNHLTQAGKACYRYEKESWFVDAVEAYLAAIRNLNRDLRPAGLGSRGLRSFRKHLENYTASTDFLSLARETEALKSELAAIRYSLWIVGERIHVSKYDSEADYGADVLATFEKFKQGAAKEHRFEFRAAAEMNHVEAAVLDLVARLYPDVFSSLDEYCTHHATFVDGLIATFDREVQFYIACLEYTERFKSAGLQFCYPNVSAESKAVHGSDVFDLALANRLIAEGSAVVTNEFYLRNRERILIVSGPNQGGKTTFARTFGQLHYLASIGCPVPAGDAALFLCDRLFTHFEREEDIQNLSSKLEDELLRIHRVLERATPRSILIMNESFLSTTLEDALFLSKQVMDRIIALDIICVSVTFLDELASLGDTTVSMVSTVDPKDPAVRTFRIVRRPADGLAYAAAIAEKHSLTYEKIKGRIARAIERPVAS